ncbi:MAG: GGDEF domain-containing protein [Microthrixaceae bacterium]
MGEIMESGYIDTTSKRTRVDALKDWAPLVLGVIAPLVLIVLILTADAIESPKTAYVGVLSAIPLLSAVFARPAATAFVAVTTWLAAAAFGYFASDGNVQAQTVRLLFIAGFGLIAIAASAVREQRQQRLMTALTVAAEADTMQRRANTDELTGLANRHGLTDAMAERAGRTVSIAMVDVDGLKTINDELGHLVGDEYLKAVASRIRSNVASRDVVARWGGDEFVVLFELDGDVAETVMNRVVRSVSGHPLATGEGPRRVSVSVGVAEWQPGEPQDDAMSRADAAMYRAKSNGRNQVVLADDPA